MIITVTGGRSFSDRAYVYFVLNGMHDSERITTLRIGGAVGADTMAYDWARSRGVPVQIFQANWQRYGKRAGPERNGRMLSAEPFADGVVAFPGGKGTEDCVRQARGAGLPVFDAAALYGEWLDKQVGSMSFEETVVEATKALMDQMRADQADSGQLTLDLGGKGDIGQFSMDFDLELTEEGREWFKSLESGANDPERPKDVLE